MTGLLDIVKEVTERLEKEGMEYFLVGSLATMYYGRPRFTQDVDLVVRIKARQVLQFEKLFPIDEYYCPPKEVLQDEVSRKGSFNLIHQNSGIKVNFVLDKETPFYASEFLRKNKIEIVPNLQIYMASPEDLILKKLDYFREGGSEKHLADIRDILMNIKIDEAYLLTWANHMGLTAEWEQV